MSIKHIQQLFFFIPPFVFFCGILIHIRGLLLMDWTAISLWELWVHFFMLIFNAAVIIGLLLKRRWGYYPGFFFCTYFSINLLCYLFIFIFSGFSEPYNLLNALSLFFIFLTLIILWKYPLIFGIKRKPPFFKKKIF
jgi:hypothetical protein